MPAIPHVVRRGAIYYWRRRLPSALAESKKSANLILGLRTSDPGRARFLAGQISALVDLCFFPAVMNCNLSQAQLQQIFRNVFTRHLDKLERVAARERMEPDFDAEKSRASDKVMGWVYRLLETRGQNAVVDARARTQMAAEGMNHSDAAEVAAMLELMRRQGVAADPPERLSAVVTDVGAEPNPMNLALAQETIYRAMASANFLTERRYDGLRDELGALTASAMTRQAEQHEKIGSAQNPRRLEHVLESHSDVKVGHAAIDDHRPGEAAPVGSRSVTESRTGAAPSPFVAPENHPFVALANGLIKKNADARVWDIKAQRQALQISTLFAKILIENGVVDLADVRQKHFAALDDLFGALAKSYGKSSKDDERSLIELRAIGAAKPAAERGLEAGTVNRHITFLGQVLTYIKSRGNQLDRDIDLSLLRRKSKTRARNKRSILNKDDMGAIFHLACFVGCAGWEGAASMTPGQHVFHRALHFVPMLLYYTGARREEICGLSVDDVNWVDAKVGRNIMRIHYISVRPNDIRRVKNEQSIRLIVLHPELIRLGFFDYVEAIRSLGYKLLFPDLKSPTSSSPLGDRFYDEFVGGLRQAVPDSVERKKVVHSIRRSFGNLLKQGGVHSEIRGDILGHAGRNVTEEIYCDPIALAKMLRQVLKIPTLTKHLEPKAIRLLPWVQDKLPPPFSRKSRKRR